jgi:hypothetical protein
MTTCRSDALNTSFFSVPGIKTHRYKDFLSSFTILAGANSLSNSLRRECACRERCVEGEKIARTNLTHHDAASWNRMKIPSYMQTTLKRWIRFDVQAFLGARVLYILKKQWLCKRNYIASKKKKEKKKPLPPGIEPGSRAIATTGWRLTSSYTNHYTTEDLQALNTCRSLVAIGRGPAITPYKPSLRPVAPFSRRFGWNEAATLRLESRPIKYIAQCTDHLILYSLSIPK